MANMTKVIADITALVNKHKLHPIEVSQAGAWLLYQANKVYADSKIERELKMVLQQKLNQDEMEEKIVELIQEANLEEEEDEESTLQSNSEEAPSLGSSTSSEQQQPNQQE